LIPFLFVRWVVTSISLHRGPPTEPLQAAWRDVVTMTLLCKIREPVSAMCDHHRARECLEIWSIPCSNLAVSLCGVVDRPRFLHLAFARRHRSPSQVLARSLAVLRRVPVGGVENTSAEPMAGDGLVVMVVSKAQLLVLDHLGSLRQKW